MPADVTKAQETESFAAQEAIAAAVQRYIDAARTGDGALMRQAFAENARISGTYAGEKVDWTRQEFCERIEKNGPVEGLDARVVSIEFQGNAGMARLEARNWRGTRYTDFFVLLQHGQDWQIADKVFFAHSRA